MSSLYFSAIRATSWNMVTRFPMGTVQSSAITVERSRAVAPYAERLALQISSISGIVLAVVTSWAPISRQSAVSRSDCAVTAASGPSTSISSMASASRGSPRWV